MVNIYCITRDELRLIREINNKIFGYFDRYSLIMSEVEYAKLNPSQTLLNVFLEMYPIDYVLVKKEGTISFWHNTTKDKIDGILKDGIMASDDSKSFGSGIYCYLYPPSHSDNSIDIQGTFTGTYYQCIADNDSNKHELKEVLLETDVITPNNLFLDFLKLR